MQEHSGNGIDKVHLFLAEGIRYHRSVVAIQLDDAFVSRGVLLPHWACNAED